MNNINYKSAFLDFIKNNPTVKLPSQEIIDSDVEFAISIWDSFDADENPDDIIGELDHTSYKYTKINFLHTFAKYLNNDEFINEIIKPNKAELLLSPIFQKENPNILKNFTSNPSWMQEMVQNYPHYIISSSNIISLIEFSSFEEEKKFYLKNIKHINLNMFEKFKEDDDICLALMNESLAHYHRINTRLQNDIAFVSQCLKKSINFWDSLHPDLKKNETLREIRFNILVNHCSYKDFLSFSIEEKIKALYTVNPDLIDYFSKYLNDHNNNQFHNSFIEFSKTNPSFTAAIINNVYFENKLNYFKENPVLVDVFNRSSVSHKFYESVKITPLEKIYEELSPISPSIKEILDNDSYFQLKKQKQEVKNSIFINSLESFQQHINTLFEHKWNDLIDENSATSWFNFINKSSSASVLKITKSYNKYDEFYSIFKKEKIQQHIPENNNKSIKYKI